MTEPSCPRTADSNRPQQVPVAVPATDRCFQALIENSRDAIALFSAEGVIQYVSPAITRILGYTQGELVGCSAFDLMHPEDVPHTTAVFAELLQQPGAHVTAEYRNRHKDGSWRWIEGTGTNLLADPDVGAIVGNFRDITARQEAEEGLRYVTTHARCLLWHGTVTDLGHGTGGFHWETQVFDEEAAQAFWPLDLRPHERYTAAWYRHRLPEHQRLTNDLSDAALRSNRPVYDAEFGCRGRDGQVRWFEERVYVEPLSPPRGWNTLLGAKVAPAGEPNPASAVGYWRVVGVAIDITERKRAEEALRESEARFRTVFSGAGMGMAVLDMGGRTIDTNPALREMLGYRAEELRGRSPLDITHPEDAPADFDLFQELLAEKRNQYQLEKRYVRKDGRLLWGQLTVSLVQDENGQAQYVIGMLEDITQRRQAEAALRDSEERFRQLAENIQEVFWMIEPGKGQMVYISPAYEKIWGRSCQSLYEAPRSFLEAIHPEDLDRVRESLQRQLQGERTEVEYRVIRPNGSVRWVLDRAFPVFDTSDSVYRVAGVAADITHLKEVEAELRHNSQAKDEFLAMLAHELRNPLAPILNAVQLMQIKGLEDPRLRRARDVVERQVHHLARLVDDLLDVSRITQGRIELRKEEVDLERAVRQAIETSRPLIEAREHELSVSVPLEPVCLEADPTRLEQILTNLLNNAAKYTEPGGHIWLTALHEGSEVVLRVRDTGTGISPELLPHIFDLFTQADRSLDRAQGGLGIGLTLVRRLAELHGGSVAAHSAGLGRGSEFVVRLPARPAVRIDSSRTTAPAEARTSGNLRVLVVDDNIDAAESLAELLDVWGHEVRVVHDGPAALEETPRYHPHVVLLDIGLPGMSGYEVARRLREQEAASEIRLVAVTGYGQEEDRQQALRGGFDAHLVKPVSLEDLGQVLAALAWRE